MYGAHGYVEQPTEFLDVIDTATSTLLIQDLQAAIFHDYLVITPDGTRLYTMSLNTKSVAIVDTSTNMVVDTIPVDYNPGFAAITSNGTRIYIANVQNTVSVLETVTNTVTATIPVPVTIPDFYGCLLQIAITPFPTNKDDCKDDGYMKFRALGFAIQGQCVKYVNRHAN